jgi:hypothetical protein
MERVCQPSSLSRRHTYCYKIYGLVFIPDAWGMEGGEHLHFPNITLLRFKNDAPLHPSVLTAMGPWFQAREAHTCGGVYKAPTPRKAEHSVKVKTHQYVNAQQRRDAYYHIAKVLDSLPKRTPRVCWSTRHLQLLGHRLYASFGWSARVLTETSNRI